MLQDVVRGMEMSAFKFRFLAMNFGQKQRTYPWAFWIRSDGKASIALSGRWWCCARAVCRPTPTWPPGVAGEQQCLSFSPSCPCSPVTHMWLHEAKDRSWSSICQVWEAA